jgi:hypothetical protein
MFFLKSNSIFVLIGGGSGRCLLLMLGLSILLFSFCPKGNVMTSIRVKIINVREPYKRGYSDEESLEDYLDNLHSVGARIISVVPKTDGRYFIVFEV